MPDLIPVLQFTEEDLVSLSGKAMDEMGIEWKSVSLSEPDDMEIPDWMDASSGGWVFFIDKNRFEEGMTRLGKLMGYSAE